MSILVTFYCSILVIFAMQQLNESSGVWTAVWALLFLSAVAAVYLLNRLLEIDYGFWGCMLPAFASLFQDRRSAPIKRFEKLAGIPLPIIMLTVGLLFLWLDLGGNQLWSLAAVPVLLLYSGERGKLPMKYFFYIFYPAHLAVLQLIDWVI